MKKKFVLGLSLSAALVAGTFVFASGNKKQEVKIKGYSTSTLPQEIDLNDTSESDIRSYYSSLNSLGTAQRQGPNLLKNLKTILKNGQKYYAYDSGKTIWQIYEIADRDWDLSPASSTTYGTYNPSTNKITGYTYGKSSSDSKNNPYIHALYINRNVTNQTTAWNDHNQDQWGINREHVWPKSQGFDDDADATGGACGDPMHLMAGNGYSNNIHSNYFYGYVKTSDSYTDCGTKYSNQYGNLRGTSLTLNTGTVFEPQDCDKGDIARAIFYMAARYNYLSGSDSDGINSDNPNLEILQSADYAPTSYVSSTTTTGKMGILTDLLNWHHQDPVDEYEIHRNNLLYTNYTNNRNPFIDFPEWVDYIWGTTTYNGNTYQSYSSTPTGYATPSSDTINGYNSGGSTVDVTGVSLDKATATVAVNGTVSLTATIAPSNATNKAVTWTSSNSGIATVSDGVVTGKAAGTATITVTTSDGGYQASCQVTVKALKSISVSGYKNSFFVGDDFTFGGTVTATYTDDSTEDVTGSSNFSGFNSNVVGEQTITVSYGGLTTTYQVTVVASGGGGEQTASGSIEAVNSDLDGWTLINTGTYADGSVKLGSSGSNVYKLDIFSGDVSQYMTKLKVTVNAKINGTADATNSYKVEAISGTSDNIATKKYDQRTGSNVYVTSYGNTIFDMEGSALSGTTGIRFTYVVRGGGNLAVKSISWEATYEVPSGPTLDTITLDTSEVRTSFFVGDEFEYDDLVVTAHYSDSTSAVVVPDSVIAPDMTTAGEKIVTVNYGSASATYTITVSVKTATSITAVLKVDKTFVVGDVITKSDITVTTDLEEDVTDSVTFNDYQFKYSDAASGGALTNKVFNISYLSLETTLTVQVQRKAHQAAGVSDTLTREVVGVTGNSYTDWSGISDSSNAVYAGNSSGSYTNTNVTPNVTIESLQLRSNKNTSGIVSTVSGGQLSKVAVSFHSGTTNNRTLNIYGSNTAYSAPSELYDESTAGTLLGTIVCGTSTELEITGSYAYVGIRSNYGAIYLNSITISYGSEDTAENVANYIMFEDTNNQCLTKLNTAIEYFEGLSDSQKEAFMTSDDYVISTARERFQAWLKNQDKVINLDYSISSAEHIEYLSAEENDTNFVIILAVLLTSTLTFMACLVIKKRKSIK